ncbi:MAG: FAD-binding oxidoreductase, partial [Alphaproteobacteria bacterium]|nr:FAD-binding oxidoreductase [Alphaproteobacteria bacterium]
MSAPVVPDQTWYAATATCPPKTGHLCGDACADVAIVGGGFTGLGAALELCAHGIQPLLIEAGELGDGASGRNGGQAHIGQRRDQIWLERVMGQADARKLWDLALDARADLDRLIGTHGIDCALTPGVFETDHKRRYLAETQHYVQHLNEVYDYPHVRFVGAEECRTLVASPGYYGGRLDTYAAHLHPLNLARGMAKAALVGGAGLRTHSPATALARTAQGWRISTPHGEITADKVILAGDGMLQRLYKPLDARVMPINNFIAVTAPLGEERARALIANNYAVSDSRFVVYYFRMTPDHRLLFGGGENYSYTFPKNIAAFVRPHIARIFPPLRDVAIDYAWGGTLGITANRMPLVRELEPGLYTAAGYSGLGVILAPYFGKILAQAIA